MTTSPNPIASAGLTPVPRNLDTLLKDVDPSSNPPKPFKREDIPFPTNDPLVDKVVDYARQELPELVFNHSMRVIYYGLAIHTQYLPHLPLPTTPYILACLLHDIGTTPANLTSTRLSFEFRGGFLALEYLMSLKEIQATGDRGKDRGGDRGRDMAESVAEAVIRHQDIGETGNLSVVGAVLQVGTVVDNMGLRKELLHDDFIDAVCQRYPRNKDGEVWSDCFADVVKRECEVKPWSHTTKMNEEGAFEKGVRGNEGMRRWE